MRRLALALLLLVAACSSGSDGAATPQLQLEPSTTTTTSPETAALAAELPTDVLTGFVVADDVLGSGPLDLEAAASAANDPAAERSRLEDTGFVRGVARSWVDQTGDTAYVALYEFETPEGAAAYDAAQRQAIQAAGAEPDGDDAFTTVEGDLTTHAVLRVDGTRWRLVLLASEDGDRTVDEARGI